MHKLLVAFCLKRPSQYLHGNNVVYLPNHENHDSQLCYMASDQGSSLFCKLLALQDNAKDGQLAYLIQTLRQSEVKLDVLHWNHLLKKTSLSIR